MTYSTISKLTFRHYSRHKILSMLCFLGISLGVGIVTAVNLINKSALSSFGASVDYLSGKADFSVVSDYGPIDERLFLQIWTLEGVEAASPIIETMAFAKETPGAPIRFVGLDPFLDSRFRNFTPSDTGAADFLKLVAGRKPAVWLAQRIMTQYGLVIGDTLTVKRTGLEFPVLIAGVLPEAPSGGASENIAVMDIAWAQEIFGKVGYIDRIDVASRESAEKIAQLLPSGLRPTDASQRKKSLEAMLKSFQLNLTAMSLIALFVGTFLIYNFAMFSVLTRREQMSLLLTLGVSPGRLLAGFFAEAAVMATVGGALGVAFGYGVAWLSIEKVSASISDLYFFLRVDHVRPTWGTCLEGMAVGFPATFIGTALPAWEVASTPPILGAKRRTIEDRVNAVKGRLFLLGLLFLALCIVWAWASRYSVFWGFASAFGATIAFALFTPALLAHGCRFLGIAFRKGFKSLSAFMAARSVSATLSRAGVAVAALAVALSMTIGVDVMIHSFRTSVDRWLERALTGDLYITPSTTKWGHPLPQELVELLERRPEVEALERYSTHDVAVNGRPARLRVIDGDVLRPRARFHFLAQEGDPWEGLINGGLFISESLAYKANLHVGDTVTLGAPGGDRAFPVVAVTRDYSSDQGAAQIDRRVYEPIWRDSRVQSAALFLKKGASVEALKTFILDEYPALADAVASNSRMRSDILNIFDKTFAPTETLKGVSLLVALLGVASALAAMMLERGKEMKALGYLGFSARELIAMQVWQALVMGTAAFLIAAPCGMLLAFIITYAVNYRSFGWSIDMTVNPVVFLNTFLLTVASCAVASLYPSYRLFRESIGAAPSDE
jgi:putative ABC transport system permease protein